MPKIDPLHQDSLHITTPLPIPNAQEYDLYNLIVIIRVQKLSDERKLWKCQIRHLFSFFFSVLDKWYLSR